MLKAIQCMNQSTNWNLSDEATHTVNTLTYSWNFVHWGNSSGFPQTLPASVWVSLKNQSLSEVSEGSSRCSLGLTTTETKLLSIIKIFTTLPVCKIHIRTIDRCFCTGMYYTNSAYLFRQRAVVFLRYVFPHRFSHRLDLFAQGNTWCWWRL